MNKSLKKEKPIEQFEYLGRWVNKEGFRAFVYNMKGDEKLANSFNEFENLLLSGLWYATRDEAETVKRKPKYDPVRTAS